MGKKHTQTEREKKKLGSAKCKKKIMKVSSRPHVCCTHSHYTELFAFCLNAFELKASILSHSVVVLSSFFLFSSFSHFGTFCIVAKGHLHGSCVISLNDEKGTAHLSHHAYIILCVFFLHSSIPSTIEI